MKKTITSLVILLMFLVPALGNASYLIRLKNGGQLATPAYWTEGKWIFFYCVGGTASMERREIDKIEKLKTEDGEYIDKTPAIAGKKELPPLPPAAEKAKEPEKPSGQKEEEATGKDDAKKDPKIMGKFKAQQKSFESRKNMSIDELSVLKDEMTALRNIIVSSQSEEDYREEISKINDMRFLLTDHILLRKAKNQ